jgi:NAD(P)H-hydrate epimerase
MVLTGGDKNLGSLPDLKPFSAIGIGPGIGTDAPTVALLYGLLKAYKKPLVLDADALNILSAHKGYLKLLPAGSILTPHPGEFKRLAGEWKDDFDKLKRQCDFAKKYKVVVVLKGANTSVAMPDGALYFNSTGNAGMAKGGSGDVLTGIITSLLAQKYTPQQAAIIGVYLHGMAGDIADNRLGQTAMNAGDIIAGLPEAFLSL